MSSADHNWGKIAAEIGNGAADKLRSYIEDPNTAAEMVRVNKGGRTPITVVNDYIVRHLPHLRLSQGVRSRVGTVVRDVLWEHGLIPSVGQDRIKGPCYLSSGALYMERPTAKVA